MSEMKHHVIGDNKTKAESWTKEEIIAAITQIVESGEVEDVDTGFVTKIKESNRNKQVSLWVGTQAEYNAIPEKEENCLYIISDDVILEDITNAIQRIDSQLSNIGDELQQIVICDEILEYGDNYNISLIGDISKYQFVSVSVETSQGANTIICGVTWLDGQGNFLVSGAGFIPVQKISETVTSPVPVNVNIKIENNKIVSNYTTEIYPEGESGATISVTFIKGLIQ